MADLKDFDCSDVKVLRKEKPLTLLLYGSKGLLNLKVKFGPEAEKKLIRTKAKTPEVVKRLLKGLSR